MDGCESAGDERTTASDDASAPLQRTVLYVDDHEANLSLMEALLRRRPNVRLELAPDAQSGYRMALAGRHDLLLLDLDLPDWHGTELLRRLREHDELRDVPAVAVTASADFELGDSGFCELWPKPLDMRLTLQRIDQMLGLPAGNPA